MEINYTVELNMEFVIEIDKWETPATRYPEKQIGSARIRRGIYNKGYYNNYGVKNYQFFKVTKLIPIMELQIKNEETKKFETWMVDDPPHWWSMQTYADNSIGRVLTGGLGLGLLIHTLADNIDVDSIIVIEKNKDVIDLIKPLLPKIEDMENIEFKIINTDFYDFIKETKEDFDRIIVDLWTSHSLDETLKILVDEVEPLNDIIKLKFPDASIVYHGFSMEI